jgi:hypothetical protein
MANIHQEAADNLAKQEKYNGGAVKGMIGQLNLNKLATERDRKEFKGRGGGGGSARPMSAKQHRNDVLNYKYKNQIDDAREQNRHGRNLEGASHAHKLSESAKRSSHKQDENRRNNDVTRTKDTLGHAKEHGKLASVDLDHKTGRHQISFGADHEGYGNGGQGDGKQQGQPGGRKAPAKGKGKGTTRGPLITRHVEEHAKQHGKNYKGSTMTEAQWKAVDAKASRAATKTKSTSAAKAKAAPAKSTRGKKS